MNRALLGACLVVAVLLVASCPLPTGLLQGGQAGTGLLPADKVNDVARVVPRSFNYETLLSLRLSLHVDLYGRNPSNPDRPPLAALGAGSASIVAQLRDPAGNLVYAGKVQPDGSLVAELRLPAAPEDMTLSLDADGFEPRSVVVRRMSAYQEVDRTMGMLALPAGAKVVDPGSGDSDGDGVADWFDAFPQDPRYAFSVKIPADGPMSIAFEDLFLCAQAGDADYNDMLVRGQLTVITDSSNRVARIEGDATEAVKKAFFTHRFGLFLEPFEGAGLLEVRKYDSSGAQVSERAERVAGQANIVLFNNSERDLGTRATFSLEFDTPQAADRVDQPPYNPYLYVYNTGYDIHLIGEQPLPGSRDPAGTTFRDAEGFPWALLVPADWKYPDDCQRIEVPYPRFTLWRESLGTEFTDWYLHYYDPYVPPNGPVVERVADINAGAGSSSPSGLAVYGSALYFSASDGTSGQELWRYDGAGAARVADINAGAGSSSPSGLAVYGSALYFSASDGTSGQELWRYDGSATVRVADINGGAGSSYPTYLAEYGGQLYFFATDDGSTYRLFAYNGSAANPVSTLRQPQYLKVYGTGLYMGAVDSAAPVGQELYRWNGTTEALVADINTGAGDSSPYNLTVYGTLLCFTADDGTSGRELWRYDGSTAVRVADINAGAGNGVDVAGMVVYGGSLYFRGTDGASGWELWRYDGSSVTRVADLNPGAGNGLSANGMAVYNGALYFCGNDGSGWQLRKYDGSAVSLVQVINAAGDANLGQFQVLGAKLYFQANDGTTGSELWSLLN